MNFKRAILVALLVWGLGVVAFSLSFLIDLIGDPELQANLVLTIAVIPAAILGAYFYYKGGATTNGLALGGVMFGVAILLDALITVPLFIIPMGGDLITFFSDPGFWLIAVIYIAAVALYWGLKVKGKESKKIEAIL